MPAPLAPAVRVSVAVNCAGRFKPTSVGSIFTSPTAMSGRFAAGATGSE